jgi:predicted  nucleic acid-binding Zn-ribbon protein
MGLLVLKGLAQSSFYPDFHHTPEGAFMNQADALYHLQEIDLNLLHIQKRVAEIEAQLADKHILEAAQTETTQAQQILDPIKKKVRALELEIQTNVDKIRQTDEQLYSGRVRNPKELQDMQHEIQAIKKRNTELEDILLETMMDAETAEGTLHEKQTEMERLNGEWESGHQDLLAEQAALKREYHTLRPKREQALTDVTPDSLKEYNTLRPRKNNQPVSRLINESCSVCGVEQNMAIIGEVRKGQKLTHCLSCGRILASK